MIDRIGGDESANAPPITTMQFVDHHFEIRSDSRFKVQRFKGWGRIGI